MQLFIISKKLSVLLKDCNEKLVDFSIKSKNVAIRGKEKTGRKSKAKKALER